MNKISKFIFILLILSLSIYTTSYAFDNEAQQILPDTSNFDNNLSSADDNVQKALDTLDNIPIGESIPEGTIEGQMLYWTESTDEYLNMDADALKWNSVTGQQELNAILFNTDYTVTGNEATGAIYWDDDNHCLSSVYEWGAILQIGFELYKIGTDAGNDYPEGFAVSAMGTNGNKILFVPTDASPTSTNYFAYIGLITSEVDSGNRVAVREGAINGINTVGGLSYGAAETWLETQVVYVDPDHPGYLTNVQPNAPDNCIKVGTITIAHANEGQIELLRQIAQRFVDLCDVNGTPLTTSGQIAVWDNSNSYFDFDSSFYALPDSGNVGIGTTEPSSKLEVAGSFSLPTVQKSATYTLTASDYQVECTANTFTVNLPTAVGISGRVYQIKNSGSGVITVDGYTTETIDGETTQDLDQYDNMQIQSNGSNWIIQ